MDFLNKLRQRLSETFRGNYGKLQKGEDNRKERAKERLEKGKKISFSDAQSQRYNINKERYIPGDTRDSNKANDKMEDVSVDNISSTAIDSMDYNPKTEVMNIKFRNNNKTYAYPNVPEDAIEGFMDAGSKGRYYNNQLKQYSVPSFRG